VKEMQDFYSYYKDRYHFEPETLDIQQEMLCYIPTTGYHEVLCWEFPCVSTDGRHVLQYINCATGQTENLLLLIENQNGTMTR
jgi:hypothetical protein